VEIREKRHKSKREILRVVEGEGRRVDKKEVMELV
jgi:hypothetical protein